MPSILYVEDSTLIADLTAETFRRAGFLVLHCKNGEDALSAFRAAPDGYDLLFTDHEMPNLSGLNLLKEMRAEGFRGAVIVNSGFLNPDIRKAYEALGPAEFLAKPARASELVAVIQAAVRTRDR